MNMHFTFWRIWTALFIVMLVAIFTMSNVRASTSDTQPYGGCKEAMNYPRSEGADICRRLGWTVTRHIVVRPDKYVVTWQDLPRCNTSDKPCHLKDWSAWVNVHGVSHPLKGVAR